MKKLFTALFLFAILGIHAQGFKGRGDLKFDLGMNLQNRGNGIRVSTDFGIGENMSYGFVSSYLLSVNTDVLGNKP
jgi:hypothetical protein